MLAPARAEPETNEYYSPLAYVERARRLMGEIDLDPASCPAANEVVRAKAIFVRRDDGLSKRWSGRVYLNPPGGKLVLDGKRWVPPKAPARLQPAGLPAPAPRARVHGVSGHLRRPRGLREGVPVMLQSPHGHGAQGEPATSRRRWS
jgi:hypothetical protein